MVLADLPHAGPAGRLGLLDYAMRSARDDAHTLAHLGAMHANVWACEAYLDVAGKEIDAHRADPASAQMRALQVRHLIEQACTDTLRRFARAYVDHIHSAWSEKSPAAIKRQNYICASPTQNAISKVLVGRSHRGSNSRVSNRADE